MKKNLALLVLLAVISGGAGIYFGTQKFALTTPEPAAVANLFGQTLPDASGKEQSLAQWRGKILIVNFWATWCGPCVEEMPELTHLQHELPAKNMQIIGVGIDSPANVADFAAKLKISYPLYVAGMRGTELTRLFGNQSGGLPYTVLIAADGHIKKTYLGRLKIEELRQDLASM